MCFTHLRSCFPNIVSLRQPVMNFLGDRAVPDHVEGLEQVPGSLHRVKHGAVPVGVPELPGEAEARTLEANPAPESRDILPLRDEASVSVRNVTQPITFSHSQSQCHLAPVSN